VNGWIEARLKNKADAMAAFHQALCVEDADFQPYVERAAPQASLHAWYASWPQHHGLAAVLGLEGNGKSWATMAGTKSSRRSLHPSGLAGSRLSPRAVRYSGQTMSPPSYPITFL
jgi:hypothetical protein